MRSTSVVSGENALAQQFTNLRHDARGAGNLLPHQQLGAIALPTNPSNGQTLTLTINGTAIVLTGTSGTPTNPGDFKIQSTAALTAAVIQAGLLQPQTTTATFIALSGANQTLVSYLSWPLSGTTITPCSNNTSLYAPLTSFSASTTATGGSYTAQTMQLFVEPGVVYVDGTRVIFAGNSTPTVTGPSTNPRIDVLTVDSSGTLAWTTGTENASPVAPTYPANKVALCELYNVVGETALYDNSNQTGGQGYISTDVRPFLGERMNWTAFASNLIPDGSGTRNLGSASFPWSTIYANAISGAAVVAYNYQDFTSSGTWTKPAGLTGTEIVIVLAWGAGGGGGTGTDAGGGGGGGCVMATFRASDLGSTVTVTLGAGGSTNAAGGNTTFGSLLTAYGGGGANSTAEGAGGGGGGTFSAGANASGTTGGAGGGPAGGATDTDGNFGGAGGGTGSGGTNPGSTGGNSYFGGGGGGGGGNNAGGGQGGKSIYGGGGGAGHGAGVAGTSVIGGNGGTPNNPGVQPGGGGGQNSTGAAGEVRVWVIT